MKRMSYKRKKRTIYLGSTDLIAITDIRRELSLSTDAGAIRYAIQDTIKRLRKLSEKANRKNE